MSSRTAGSITQAAFRIRGMDCASCVAHVDRAIRAIDGVREVHVNLARGRASVEFDPSRVRPEQISTLVTAAGYPANPETPRAGLAEQARLEQKAADHHAREWGWRALLGICLWVPLEAGHLLAELVLGYHEHTAGPKTWVMFAGSTIAFVLVGSAFVRRAIASLRVGATNMDVLVSLGAGTAYLYSVGGLVGGLMGWWQQPKHLYFSESVALLALISLGHWLEARARDKAGTSIRQLMELAPVSARRVGRHTPPVRPGVGRRSLPVANGHAGTPPTADGGPRAADVEDDVPVDQLVLDDVIQVRPGERIATDGVILEGFANVDESMLTGEPLPVFRETGDDVIGGTINRDGLLRVRVTRVGSQTALAQIVRLVEQAQNARPAVQRMADRISAVFVPVVLVLAVLTGVGWAVAGVAMGWPGEVIAGQVAKTVCSVLIIACPCALGIALPAALMVGTGTGAKRGILIRNLEALHHGEKVRTIVLDKTGTLTRGQPAVDRIDADHPTELLRLTASAESGSEHPLARAIVAHAQTLGLSLSKPTSFTSHAGRGIAATIDGQPLLVGNADHLAAAGIAVAPSGGVGSVVHVARADTRQVLGSIRLSDQLKPDTAAAVAELRAMGLRVVMLTGDNQTSARSIARQIGIEEVIADVRPDQKAEAIHRLKAGSRPTIEGQLASTKRSPFARRWARACGTVAMVGDGINDAPALACADLGIAIGSGTDIAKETGGIVLVGSSIAGVATALRLSRVTMSKIRQNFFWAFAYNVCAIPLAMAGLLTPLIAAAAMALSDVTVIGNALLIPRKLQREVRKHKATAIRSQARGTTHPSPDIRLSG